MTYDKEPQSRSSWINEFDNLMGINMAYNEKVPTVVNMFEEVISSQKFNVNDVLDAGCGKGRIGLHLAKRGYNVTGIDFVPSALAQFTAIAKKIGVYSNVNVKECDLFGKWCVEDTSMDAVFAITVIENLVRKQSIDNFRKEINRVLRYGGMLVLEWYTPMDGYYTSLPDAEGYFEGNIVFDRKNEIQFRLFTVDEITQWFVKEYDLLDRKTKHFTSKKYGAKYNRETEIVFFRRTK